jgi:hypothetical protein
MNGQGACSLLLQLRPHRDDGVGSRASARERRTRSLRRPRGNVAHRRRDRWEVAAVGAPNIGERSEKATLTCSLGES